MSRTPPVVKRPTTKQMPCLTRKLGKKRVAALIRGSKVKAKDRRAFRAG